MFNSTLSIGLPGPYELLTVVGLLFWVAVIWAIVKLLRKPTGPPHPPTRR